jgi:hypothetical protein
MSETGGSYGAVVLVSYVLRLSSESLADGVLRGEVEHVESGRRAVVRDLHDLFEQLVTLAEASGWHSDGVSNDADDDQPP